MPSQLNKMLNNSVFLWLMGIIGIITVLMPLIILNNHSLSNNGTPEHQFAEQVKNLHGYIVPNDIRPSTIKGTLAKITKASNNSFWRLFKHKPNPNVQLYLIPSESWGQWMDYINYYPDAIKPYVGGYCTSDVTQSSRTIAIPWDRKNWQWMLTVLNHERVHCELDNQHTEVLSQLGAYLLNLDYALATNDRQLFDYNNEIYLSLSGSAKYSTDRFIFWGFLHQQRNNPKNYLELTGDLPNFFGILSNREVWPYQEINYAILPHLQKDFMHFVSDLVYNRQEQYKDSLRTPNSIVSEVIRWGEDEDDNWQESGFFFRHPHHDDE